MADIGFGITATDKGANAAIEKEVAALFDMQHAIAQLAATEQKAHLMEQAKVAMQNMTAAEKEAYIAADKATQEINKQFEQNAAAAQKASQAEIQAAQEAEQAQTQGAESMGLKFTEMRSQLQLAEQGVQAFVGVFQEAFAYGKQGAAVAQTAQSFDGLIDKVGASTDLLEQLQAASRGTVDAMTLETATTTLLMGASDTLAVHLANATPQLLEIAKAANKLNPSLGDTAFLYESIATGIKRASPMILDNLGLTLKIGAANDAYAASLGKTATELTAEEQKVALLNAALDAGKNLIAQAGGNADAAGDSFARLSVDFKNLGDDISEKFYPPLAAAANVIDLMLTANIQIKDALDKHAIEVENTSKTYQEYDTEMTRAAKVAGYMVDVYGGLYDANGNLIQSNWKLNESQFFVEQSSKQVAAAAKAQQKALDELNRTAMADAITQANNAADSESNLALKIYDTAQAMKLIGLEAANYNTVMASTNKLTDASLFEKMAGMLTNDAAETQKLGEMLGVINPVALIFNEELQKINQRMQNDPQNIAIYAKQLEALAADWNSIKDKDAKLNLSIGGVPLDILQQFLNYGLNPPGQTPTSPVAGAGSQPSGNYVAPKTYTGNEGFSGNVVTAPQVYGPPPAGASSQTPGYYGFSMTPTVTAPKPTVITVDTSQARRDLAQVQAAIDALANKTLTVTVVKNDPDGLMKYWNGAGNRPT